MASEDHWYGRWEGKRNQSAEPMDGDDARVAKLLLKLGFQQRRIAALFDVNQGRIAEIHTGERFENFPSLLVWSEPEAGT